MTTLLVAAWFTALAAAVWLPQSPGWLPCDRRDWPHPRHEYVYTDASTGVATPVVCDGVSRSEQETCGCSDFLCACTSRPSGWSTGRAGAMNGGRE